MIHLTLNQLSAFIDSELPDASVELVRLHLSSCLECAERFGYIEEQEDVLARLILNDPGDPFFESFSDRVLGPPRAAAPGPERRTEPRAPRRERPPRPIGRGRRGAGRFLVPAAAILLVAGAVAVVVVRSGTPPRGGPGAPGSEATNPAAPAPSR